MNSDNQAIFVIEDDEELGPLLKFIFERQGFTVTLFADGRSAARMIDVTPHPPALVLLDVMIPYANGYSTMSKMRHRQGWEAVPIVMLSGLSAEEDVVRAFELGANDYLTKPFQPAELLARAKRLVAAT